MSKARTPEPVAYSVSQFCALAGFTRQRLYQLVQKGRVRLIHAPGNRSLVMGVEGRRFLVQRGKVKGRSR